MTINITKASKVLIALGSNIGNRSFFISQALQMMELEEEIFPINFSPIYETAPIGNADRAFLNGATIANTSLTPEKCLQALLRIEKKLGRIRQIHWGNRCIDLDIILWKNADEEDVICNNQFLTIPHPRALGRDFVLVPASRIAPNWTFPGTKKTLAQLVQELNFQLPIQESNYESCL